MITIQVYLKNDFDSKYTDVEITREELLQLACNKARGQFPEGYYNVITAEDEIKVTGHIN